MLPGSLLLEGGLGGADWGRVWALGPGVGDVSHRVPEAGSPSSGFQPVRGEGVSGVA